MVIFPFFHNLNTNIRDPIGISLLLLHRRGALKCVAILLLIIARPFLSVLDLEEWL